METFRGISLVDLLRQIVQPLEELVERYFDGFLEQLNSCLCMPSISILQVIRAIRT